MNIDANTIDPDDPQTRIQRELFDLSPLSIHAIDGRGEFFSMNRAGLNILGFSHLDEAVGRAYLEFVHESDRDWVQEALAKGWRGETSRFEFDTTDGRVFESHLVPSYDASGVDVVALMGLSQDVTERRLTEVALRESEERYRLLVEQSPYCIHQFDTQGRLTSMNRAGLNMMDMEDECEITGAVYLDIVAPCDRDRIGQLLQAAYNGQVSKFEFEAVNGRFFSSSFIPLIDDEGRILRLMGLTQDVSGRRIANRALRASEQRLDLALKGANLGLWDHDVEKCEVVLNQRMCTILGIESDSADVSVSSMLEYVHPDDRAAVQELVDAHLSGQTPGYESEHRILSPSGDIRRVIDRGTVAERNEAGDPVRFIGITLDVTEQKEAERHREHLSLQLQQAQKMESVGQLAGGVAHDFNNLLQVILGHVEIILSESGSGDEYAEDLHEIRHAAERGADLTRRLLTISREQPSDWRIVNLNEVVSTMMSMLPRVITKSINLAFVPAPNLPLVEVDPRQIEQALLNLCINARDAMPVGGELTLRTEHRPASGAGGTDEVRVTVSDNGEGMEPVVVRRAVEPFFTTKGPQKGTGLGLSMVYGIVQQNKGTLDIESEPGKGTQIHMSFAVSDQLETPIERETEYVHEAKGETILVIEDEKAVRNLAERMLVQAGYTVITAENGVKGIELFDRYKGVIDLALIDAVMPLMSGREVSEQLLRRAPDLNILFMSGYYHGVAISDNFLEDHGLQVLNKPFSREALLKNVRLVLTSAAHD